MKEIEVQTENQDKEIINSSIVKINETDDRIKVIVSITKPLDRKRRKQIHDEITKAIEEGKKVITISDFVKINTIKI